MNGQGGQGRFDDIPTSGDVGAAAGQRQNAITSTGTPPTTSPATSQSSAAGATCAKTGGLKSSANSRLITSPELWLPAGVKPYFQDESTLIIHADCRDILPLMPKVDLVLTDPPYGMNYNTDSRRFAGGANGESRYGQGQAARPIAGDAGPFDPTPFLRYPAVIMWGFNHWAQRVPTGTVLVWLKKREHRFGSFLSDAELAWEKDGYGVYAKYVPGDGRWDLAEGFPRCHPAQKPAALMRWCLDRHPGAQTILDPFMGSGTTLRAAKDLGRYAIGIEIEEKYCRIAADRMAQGVLL
ncbi:hypothetical protein LCGC14_1877080 [marine sediment metagenome]|uniref:DNA methylase N-4/N-6 domain-containing protein n=1 Tax=marine sediment metagenome TaxID=412755 RepID=A0A0F9J1X9_9ZZZZ